MMNLRRCAEKVHSIVNEPDRRKWSLGQGKNEDRGLIASLG